MAAKISGCKDAVRALVSDGRLETAVGRIFSVN